MRGRTPKYPQSIRVLTLVHPNHLIPLSIMVSTADSYRVIVVWGTDSPHLAQINPFSTPSRKDSSLQTMKRRLCGRLGGARSVCQRPCIYEIILTSFFQKPSDESDNKTLYSLSDSDCSTLVSRLFIVQSEVVDLVARSTTISTTS